MAMTDVSALSAVRREAVWCLLLSLLYLSLSMWEGGLCGQWRQEGREREERGSMLTLAIEKREREGQRHRECREGDYAREWWQQY